MSEGTEKAPEVKKVPETVSLQLRQSPFSFLRRRVVMACLLKNEPASQTCRMPTEGVAAAKKSLMTHTRMAACE